MLWGYLHGIRKGKSQERKKSGVTRRVVLFVFLIRGSTVYSAVTLVHKNNFTPI